MLDTNVLISALIFGGKAGKLLGLLFDSEHELYRKLDIHFCSSTKELFGNLRDAKDIPVLSDAIYHNIDLILSGDKDFLEAGLKYPLIYSPSMMLEYLESKQEKQ